MYNQSLLEILNQLHSTEEGLSIEEAEKRLKKFGLNELSEKKKIPAWLHFLYQFKDFMILILIMVQLPV
jgi:Ca2+-transporting ATPase